MQTTLNTLIVAFSAAILTWFTWVAWQLDHDDLTKHK
jgi:hypothetical protein